MPSVVLEADTIEWLSYHLVTMSGPDWIDDSKPIRVDGFQYGWRRVVSPSGKTGWVLQKHVAGLEDTRLRFTKIGGAWKLVAIATGE